MKERRPLSQPRTKRRLLDVLRYLLDGDLWMIVLPALGRSQCGAAVAIADNDESFARPVLEIWRDRCRPRSAHRS